MTLSFKTQINGKPTYFVEKIWKGLWETNNVEFIIMSSEYEFGYNEISPLKYVEQENIHTYNPKLHTIREDPHCRWRPGRRIHPVINNRSPNRFQFAPVIKCQSVQSITILYNDGNPAVYLGDTCESGMPFYFKDFDEEDGQYICYGENQMLQLAQNDGFDSIADFFAYFHKDFSGKIIHWTNLKY